MRVKAGWIVKVADIGRPAKVLGVDSAYAELYFRFTDEELICRCPVSIIAYIISREESS